MIFFCSLWLVGIVIWSAAALTFYWGVIDRKPPIVISKESTALFNETTHQLQPAMHNIRNRWCDGVRHAYLEDGFKQNLADLAIPSDVYEQGQDRPGKPFVAFPHAIDVDLRIKDSFDYHVTLVYWCNPLQRYFPPAAIVVHAPVIHVSQADWLK